jgi:hypothetical protein
MTQLTEYVGCGRALASSVGSGDRPVSYSKHQSATWRARRPGYRVRTKPVKAILKLSAPPELRLKSVH